MNNQLTDITLVVDRSGSMESCRDEAQGGIDSFIREQKEASGDALFTLVQFDTEYDFVHNGTPVEDVGPYKLVPRGMTALLDAVGRAINETGDRLSAMPEEERPGMVVFVIATDGHENSSHEFTIDKVREMITRQRDEYQWKFLFLGADESAFDDGRDMGLNTAHVSPSPDVARGYRVTGQKVSKMREEYTSGGIGAVSCGFTDEEREELNG